MELPQEEYGVFYTENSYIILYTYSLPDGDKRYILYYWQGRHSSKEDQGTCALLVKDIGATLSGSTQVINYYIKFQAP